MRGRTPKGSTIGGGPFFLSDQLSSTGLLTCFHWPVETRTLACGNTYTGQWKHVHYKVDDDWSAFIKLLIASINRLSLNRAIQKNVTN